MRFTFNVAGDNVLDKWIKKKPKYPFNSLMRAYCIVQEKNHGTKEIVNFYNFN